MVQRNYAGLNLAAQDANAQYVQGTGGYKGPDVAAHTTLSTGSEGQDRTLQSILGDVSGVMQVGLKTSQEEAYLAGALKASTGEAESTLEGNFTTKGWATAGYRDTAVKLKIADSEANLAKDMQRLREEGPEKMQAYLTERRAGILPALEGTSREQRAGALATMLTSERAAMAKHTAEHTKFQVEQLVKTAQAGNAVQNARLEEARVSNDPKQYTEALNASAAYIASNILLEPRLPEDVKAKMTTQVIEQALSTGNVKLYTALRDNNLPGTDGTLLERLPIEDQMKLSQAHYAAVQKVDGIANRDLMTRKALVTAEMANGTHSGSWDDAQARADEWLRVYPSDFKGGEAILNQYIEYKNKDHNSDAIAAAGAVGDFAKAQGLGADEHKTVSAMRDKMNRDGVPAAQQIAVLMNTGTTGGSTAALQEAGKSIGLAVASLANADGTLNTNNSQIIQTTLNALDSYKGSNQEIATSAILSGMSDTTRLRLQRLQGASQKGFSPQQALAWVQGQETRDSTELPAAKAAREHNLAKEVLAYQDDIAPAGWWARAMSHAPLVGRTEAQAGLSPSTSWWNDMTDNSTVTHQYAEVSKGAINGEVQAELLRPNSGDPAAIVQAAEAKVLARKVDTVYGPLIVPQDKSPSAYFGINASPAEFSKAISNVIPVQSSKSRVAYEVTNGRITYTEYNKDGNTVLQERQTIAPDTVRAEVKRLQDLGLKRTDEAMGKGVSIVVEGAALSYNGLNTASMDERVMLSMRRDLIKYEGYAGKAAPDVGGGKHKDGTPIMTGGFGVSSTNTYFPKGAPDVADLQAKGVDKASWGARPDGTAKGEGFLGILKRPDGGVSTEISIGINVGGTEMEVPTLVPTLTRQEVITLLALKDGQKMPESIVRKAAEHAKTRVAAGKPVFAQPGEQSTGGTSPQQWMDAFKKASNQAALEGVKLTQENGLLGPAWQQLASELVYQSGADTVRTDPSYKALLQRQAGTRSVDLIQQTPAWKASGAERRKHLMSLLNQANNRG